MDFEEFIRWMYAQPVDAKAICWYLLLCSLSCLGRSRFSQEKMLGSTAVAKQLLREIADKLIAENIPPEHLFASLRCNELYLSPDL